MLVTHEDESIYQVNNNNHVIPVLLNQIVDQIRDYIGHSSAMY